MTSPAPSSSSPRRRPARRLARALELGILASVAVLALSRCDRRTANISGTDAARLTGGDPARGRTAIERYGCASCHTISGVPGANALVGPPLTEIGARAYVAGVLVNTPANLIRWIRDPQGVDSLTAMPNLGVTEQDARDIAAYLYSRH